MEIAIFPSVLQTGARVLRAGLEANQTDEEIAIAVYMAMDELMHVVYLAGGEERH